MNEQITKIKNIINTQNSPPVKIFKILKGFGITPVSIDFTKIERLLDQQNIQGIIYKKNKQTYFFYPEQIDDIKRRITVTYELVYDILYPDKIQKRFILPNEHSDYITQHMTDLLIPPKSIKKLHTEFIVAPALTDLAGFYQVPERIMQKQLDDLSLSYIKNKSFLF